MEMGQYIGGVGETGSTELRLVTKPYALYKSLALLGYFDTPGEAFAAGIAQFPDGTFSIQETARPPRVQELRTGH